MNAAVDIGETQHDVEEHVLFEMKGCARSEWKYVRLVAKKGLETRTNFKSSDASKAYCLLCKEYLTYSTGNGNSVYRHVNKKHKNVIDEANESLKASKKQKTLKEHFSNIVKRENMKSASKEDRLLGDALLVKWTSECLRPFKIVGDTGFVEFCRFLNQLRSTYDLPSRNKHRNQMMKLADCVMKKVKESISNDMDFYSITTDIWSSRVMQSFMAVTLHYLTEEFEMKTFVVEVLPLKGSHTGEFIAECLSNTLSSFNLRLSKLALILRDNASNGIKACEKLKAPHFGCIGHSLHLVVGPFLLEKHAATNTIETEFVDENAANDDDDDAVGYDFIENENSAEIVNRVCTIVSKFRKVAKYIKNSPKCKEKIEHFDQMARASNRDTIHIALDVRTRWNSVLEMLMSMLKLKTGITSFLYHLKTVAGRKEFNYKKLPDVSEQDWVLIEGVCLVLQPFKNVTSKLSGNKYPTFSQALPYLRSLKMFLANAEENLFTKESDIIPVKEFVHKYIDEDYFQNVIIDLKMCCRELHEKFKVRFSGMNIEILWVTFLDPRSRKMKHLSKGEFCSAKELFIEEVKELSLAQHRNMTPTTIDLLCEGPVDEDEDPFLMGIEFDSPTKPANLIQENSDDNAIEFELHATAVGREVENYLDPHMFVSAKTDPLQWWSENGYRFPKIAMAARKWLCIPGTSTASERVFSHCGIALSAKRSTMRGDALMNQILLKNNLSSILCTVEDIKKALGKC